MLDRSSEVRSTSERGRIDMLVVVKVESLTSCGIRLNDGSTEETFGVGVGEKGRYLACHKVGLDQQGNAFEAWRVDGEGSAELSLTITRDSLSHWHTSGAAEVDARADFLRSHMDLESTFGYTDELLVIRAKLREASENPQDKI